MTTNWFTILLIKGENELMKTKKWLEFLVGAVAILTLVVLVTSFTGAVSAKDSTIGNVGYVDVVKLHQEMPDFTNLEAVMKEKESGFKYFQGYLFSQHRTAVKGLQDKATAEKDGKTPEEQAAIDNKLQEDLKKKSDELNAQLEKERSKIMQELNDMKNTADEKTKTIISEVAKDKKLGIVFDKNAVLYGGTDITDEVIAQGKKKAKKAETKDAKK
jgi:Skp family chaperone for outer membrane proteins